MARGPGFYAFGLVTCAEHGSRPNAGKQIPDSIVLRTKTEPVPVLLLNCIEMKPIVDIIERLFRY